MLVFEDPNDGYRSSATSPMVMGGSLYQLCDNVNYIFVPSLVRIWEAGDDRYGGVNEGIEILDRRNGKTILTLGTTDVDDYYPSFVCDWRPENVAGAEPTASQTEREPKP